MTEQLRFIRHDDKGLKKTETNMWGGFSIALCTRIGNKVKVVSLNSSCRAYLSDRLYYHKNQTGELKTDNTGYRKYDNKIPDFNKDFGYTYIQLTMSPTNKRHFLANLPWLHDIEDKMGIRRTEVLRTVSKAVFIVKASKHIKNSCWKIFLYTFYLKCAMFENPYDCQPGYWDALQHKGNEPIYWANMKKDTEVFDIPTYKGGSPHGRPGFCEISQGYNPVMARILGVNDIPYPEGEEEEIVRPNTNQFKKILAELVAKQTPKVVKQPEEYD